MAINSSEMSSIYCGFAEFTGMDFAGIHGFSDILHGIRSIQTNDYLGKSNQFLWIFNVDFRKSAIYIVN